MTKRQKYVVWGIVAAIIILIIYFATHFYEKLIAIMMPFFLAMVIAYLIRPLVGKLVEYKIPITWAIIIVYVGFMLLFSLLIIFIIPDMINNTKELLETLPEAVSKCNRKFNNCISYIISNKWDPDIKKLVEQEITRIALAVQTYIVGMLRKSSEMIFSMATVFFDLLVALVVAFYFIRDTQFFKDFALSLIPKNWRNPIVGVGREVHDILKNFIQGQLLTAIIVGGLQVIGLLILKVRYPIVLGMVAGIFNVIPYFGPIIGALPAMAVALLDYPLKAIWVLVMFLVVQQIDNVFISPKIIEGKLGLHPVTTVLLVMIGGEFFGIFGMLFAVPVAAIIKVMAKKVIDLVV